MFLYVVYIISTIIINIAVLCCQLVKLNNLYYINMFTRTLVLFTQSQNIHPLIKQSGIRNVLVFVPLVLHGMIYMFKFKIQLYTIIKTKSVTIVYVYMYFHNVVGICVLMCLGVVCPRYAAGVEHAHYMVHIVSIIHTRGNSYITSIDMRCGKVANMNYNNNNCLKSNIQ